jgi:uncharacterized protein
MKCCLGLLTVDLHIEQSQSLKARRSVVKSLKERLQQRYNISVAEADNGERWQRAGLMIASVAAVPSMVEQTLRSAALFLDEDQRIMVLSSDIRYYE